ncbi:4Fe-4S dicluster domain-containing protein [Saccharicrinis sp. 156]|uniref:4Fe-4S dicluster domain-containing protein n=1 Tax=Saccharicrinis sp. 156 TaxID=3417574 RepID=UPI003D3400EA
MIQIIYFILAALNSSFFIWYAMVSYSEKEPLATMRSLLLAITSIPFIAAGYLPQETGLTILIILLTLTIVAAVLFYIPFKRLAVENESSGNRIDERNTMFSRLEITQSPEKTKTYYAENPEHLALDKKWQIKHGLMSSSSSMYEVKAFAAAEASFNVIASLRNSVSPAPLAIKKILNTKDATVFIKNWAKKLGAIDAGVCELKPYHFYSHRGRGKVYGDKVEIHHQYGIAITVEMDKDYLAAGPAAPTLMESAQQYLNSGSIALQLAHFCANMGYSARAHIDGNYEVVCPLVARDAGLGEIGRMGLLMTRSLGPRVRIAVITTDMPLLADDRKHDATVLDFCDICKKCAEVCPGQAIPTDDKKEIHGIRRWQINQEECFSYWCTTGTDCGRCMSVCPYSHPNNRLHNLVRWGIKKSWLFRRMALWMDDFFYGRKPKPIKLKF